MPSIPAISVLMNVRNGLPHIGAAVSSILGQTFRDHELIIIDDGSDDGTSEWLHQRKTEDPRIKVLRLEPSGIPRALNAGLEIAQGDLIAKMDADDIALPHRFERQIAEFRQHPGLVLLGSEVEMIDQDGLPLGKRGHSFGHSPIRKQLLEANGGALTHPAVMFRKDAALSIGGYDPEFPVGQDLDLFLRLSEIGEARNLPETLLHWRQHGTSINRTKSADWQDLKRRAIRKTIERIGAERFAAEMVPEPSKPLVAATPQGFAKRALKHQRFGTAASYGKRMLSEPGQRIRGSQLLVKTAVRWLRSVIRPS